MHVAESRGWLAGAKRRLFPKGVRRWGEFQKARVLERTREADFVRCFESLDMPDEAVICIHAAMSGFGYLTHGMESVFRAVDEAVHDATVMMPSFPFSETTQSYLRDDPLFDRETTPSRSGALSEAFRTMPGVVRGYHPTHPCLAFGPRAHDLIDGSEDCITPFGDDSTYGRYSRMPNAVLLLLHTNSTSHVHRLQELVNWPNLFLPGTAPARGRDPFGAARTYHVNVHRPRLPLYATVDGGRGEPRYLWLPDYVLQFPSARREKILGQLSGTPAADLLDARQKDLIASGVLRVARCGPGEVMAIDLGSWQARMCADLTRSFGEWAAAYSLEALTDADRMGLLR